MIEKTGGLSVKVRAVLRRWFIAGGWFTLIFASAIAWTAWWEIIT